MKKMLLGVMLILLGIYLALMGYCYSWPFVDNGHILFIVFGVVTTTLGYVEKTD